jgi:hypothetical protein
VPGSIISAIRNGPGVRAAVSENGSNGGGAQLASPGS